MLIPRTKSVGMAMAVAVAISTLLSCDGGPTGSDGFSPAWRYPSVGLFLGRPGADDERVVIAVLDSVIALSQSTGNPEWKLVPRGVEIQTVDLPLVAGVLYLINNGFVFAYDGVTGSEVWESELPGPGLDFGGSGVEVGQDRVYAARRGGAVYGLQRQTGTVLWQTNVDPQPTRMIEIGDMVCVPSNNLGQGLPQGAITCLDGNTGDVVWRYDVPDVDGNGQRICANGGVSARPTVAGNAMLFGEQCGQLIALDIETGGVIWNLETNSAFDSSVIVDGEIAYVCARAATCFAFRVADGSIVWTANVFGSVVTDPVLSGNDLLVLHIGGTLLRLDKSTGAVLGEVRSTDDGAVLSTAPVLRGGLIFSGGGTFFYGFEAP